MKENDAPHPIGELEPPPQVAKRADDPTILARWLYSAYQQGPIFWVILGGLAICFFVLTFVVSSLSAAKSVTSEAWFGLIPARTAEDQLKIADANPKTPVADWARLQAAYEEYRLGLDDLTTAGKRESAGPRLKRALDLFGQVAKEAPKDAPQSRGAAFAVARVLEARNELPEAIRQYRLVAETWKDSPEAKQAIALARTLEDPASVQFYKDLYAAKPGPNLGAAGTIPDFAAPPFKAPEAKPIDLIPGPGGAGKPYLPDFGPAGLDPPPPSKPLVPAVPPATPSPASPEPAPAAKAVDGPVATPATNPVEIPAPEPPTANPPK